MASTTSDTDGYKSYDEALPPEPPHTFAAAAALPSRVAVLVLHGMGAQKPYETLDQFARGLRNFFGVRKSDQQLKLRQNQANPNTNEKDWTQAYVQIRPGRSDNDIIDVYEYYWAPVITDKVSALQSLKFLIFTGLTPFQYLRDNLAVIDRANADSVTGHPVMPRVKWMVGSLARELFRMFFIFIPLIVASAMLYSLIAHRLIDIFLPGGQHVALAEFLLPDPHLTMQRQLFQLAMHVLRLLLLGMTLNYGVQELVAVWKYVHGTGGPKLSKTQKSSRLIAWGLVTLFGIFVYVTPLLATWLAPGTMTAAHAFTQLTFRRQSLVVVAALGELGFILWLSSEIVRLAWTRGFEEFHRQFRLYLGLAAVFVALVILLARFGTAACKQFVIAALMLPHYLIWKHLLEYAVLALVVYLASKFLTTAIGCLVVYLGADELSKNYAARSQIRHECTQAILRLIDDQDENGRPTARYTYDKVFVAAHSLGSVVAYDALNQIIIRSEAGDPTVTRLTLTKLSGLLTFGCPLNKVFYFFRTRTSLQTTVLSQVLYALHPFRLRSGLPPEANPDVSLPHPFPATDTFGSFCWFNAYSPFDLISGRMLFYRADADVPVEDGVMPWTAHLSYWDNPRLYTLFSRML